MAAASAERFSSCDVGVFGMGTMGQNLALNIASRGFTVAAYNRPDEFQVSPSEPTHARHTERERERERDKVGVHLTGRSCRAIRKRVCLLQPLIFLVWMDELN